MFLAENAVLVGVGLFATATGVLTFIRFRRDPITPLPLVASCLVSMGIATVTFNGVRLTTHATFSDGLFLTATVVWAISIIFRVNVLPPIPKWIIGFGFAFLLVGLISSAFSQSRAASLAVVGEFFLAAFAVPILLGASSLSLKWSTWFADLWLVSAATNAAVGVLGFFHVVRIQTTTIEPVFIERAPGLTVHPNHLGLVCAMVVPIAILRATQTGSRIQRAFYVALGVATGLGVLASGSRAGLLATVFGVVLTLLIAADRPRLAALVIGGGVGALTLIVGLAALTTHQRFIGLYRLIGLESVGDANVTRLESYRKALSDFAGSPLFGRGFQLMRTAHDLFLQLLQASGLLGFLVFGGYVFGTLRLAIKPYEGVSRSDEARALRLTLAICLGIWLVNGLFQNEIFDRFIYIPNGLILGLYLQSRGKPEITHVGASAQPRLYA